MKEELKHILTRVDEWLRFAEAKNGALLAANVAILFGLLRLLSEPTAHGPAAHLATLFMIGSALSTLVSFSPQLRIPPHVHKRTTDMEANLLFFGDIAQYDPQGYIEALYAGWAIDPSSVTPIELDYAQQIVVNSRIAVRKYRCFRVGLVLTVVALVVLLVAGLKSFMAV